MVKVSIIMGVYNGSKVISRSIESILNQSFKDFELIICDDGSKDDTIKIIQEYINRDSRIILIRNPYNMKLSATLNNCLKIAKGQYIARMDDDDVASPNRVEFQYRFLEAHQDIDLLGCSRNLFDNNGVWGQEIYKGEFTVEDIFSGRHSIVHPSIMIRKSAIDSVGGYTDSVNVERNEDLDLWFKLLKKGYKLYNTEEVLLDYYEARDSYAKRKYKFRLVNSKLKWRWKHEFKLPMIYNIYIIKPLLVGLLPDRVLMYHHSKRYK